MCSTVPGRAAPATHYDCTLRVASTHHDGTVTYMTTGPSSISALDWSPSTMTPPPLDPDQVDWLYEPSSHTRTAPLDPYPLDSGDTNAGGS